MHCHIIVILWSLQHLLLNHPDCTFIVAQRQLARLRNLSEMAIFNDDLLLKRPTGGWMKCETEDNGDDFNTHCGRSGTITPSTLMLNCRLIAQD